MRILLISPNTLTEPYPVYPIGLDYVSGAVDPRHEVRIVDLNTMSLRELDALLVAYKPQVVGISCRNIDNTDEGESRSFTRSYRSLINRIRGCCRAVIVCGGAGFTIMPDRIFAALNPDYGIIGEGERFGLLVEALDKGLDPARVEGVISSPGAHTPPEPWPGKRIRAFCKEASHHRFYTSRGGMLNLQTKRGCAFSCLYCPYPHIEGAKHRLYDPETVADTAKQLQEAGARYIFITDSAFNSDIGHSLAVARAMRRAGITVPWGGFFAPVRLPGDYFRVMADCGLTHAEFGTESLSVSMLKTYRKPFTPEHVFAAHAAARKAGIHTAHYFLLGGPGESRATVRESLDNIEKLDRVVLFFFIGIRIYPWTGLYRTALDEGQIDPDTDLLEPMFYRAEGISRDELEQMVLEQAGGRPNWIVGSGGERSAQIVARLHERGLAGPLWEFLAR